MLVLKPQWIRKVRKIGQKESRRKERRSKELFLEETEVLGSKGRVETVTPIHWFLSFK